MEIKQKLLFWMRLIAINHLTALKLYLKVKSVSPATLFILQVYLS